MCTHYVDYDSFVDRHLYITTLEDELSPHVCAMIYKYTETCVVFIRSLYGNRVTNKDDVAIPRKFICASFRLPDHATFEYSAFYLYYKTLTVGFNAITERMCLDAKYMDLFEIPKEHRTKRVVLDVFKRCGNIRGNVKYIPEKYLEDQWFMIALVKIYPEILRYIDKDYITPELYKLAQKLIGKKHMTGILCNAYKALSIIMGGDVTFS